MVIYAELPTELNIFSIRNSKLANEQNPPSHPSTIVTDPAIFLTIIFKILFVCLFVCLFIYFLAALGLCCCVRAFSSCVERGLLLVEVRGLLIAVASLVAEHGL